jgi:predicted amidohydrolase
MKICAVQLRLTAGDLAANLLKHIRCVEVAATHGAELIYFSELSLTAYEPSLAKTLAMTSVDTRLAVFQQLSDAHNLTIGVGLPLKRDDDVQIGMVWYAPKVACRVYAKQQLHSSELAYFVSGINQLVITTSDHNIAPAICYESLLSNHANNAAKLSADIYLASVAKSASVLDKAIPHYPLVARQHHMFVMMANSVGLCDKWQSVGQSAAWERDGVLLAQMDSESEGWVMLDTLTAKASIHLLEAA